MTKGERMNQHLIDRLAEEWAQLDPVDPLRGLIADAIAEINKQPAQVAEPRKQEPVAWMTQARCFVDSREFTQEQAALYGWTPLCTTPQPPAQPLTDEEIGKAWAVADGEHNASASVKRRITRAIEAAHGIGEKK